MAEAEDADAGSPAAATAADPAAAEGATAPDAAAEEDQGDGGPVHEAVTRNAMDEAKAARANKKMAMFGAKKEEAKDGADEGEEGKDDEEGKEEEKEEEHEIVALATSGKYDGFVIDKDGGIVDPETGDVVARDDALKDLGRAREKGKCTIDAAGAILDADGDVVGTIADKLKKAKVNPNAIHYSASAAAASVPRLCPVEE